MSRIRGITGAAAVVAAAAGWASAQPVLTALGTTPSGVSNPQGGTYYISGSNARWTLNSATLTFSTIGASGGGHISADGAYQTVSIANNGAITGNSFSPVSPAWSIPAGPFTPVVLPAANLIAARYTAAGGTIAGLPGIPNDAYSQSYGVFGSGDSGNVHTPTCLSQNGRFIGVQSYISTYNGTGTAIAGTSTFRWRAGIWDGNTNTMRTLPAPFRTSSPTQRRRDTTVWGVSNDGLVIVGAQEHNVASTPTSTDPDGGRLVVWRWDSGLGDYVMSYLPNGVNGSGFPYTYSTSIGTVHMNGAGTIIVGPAAADNTGSIYLAKWVWNPGASSWDPPVSLGTNLAVQASWLPAAVTSCGINQPVAQPTLTVTGISEDGNTVVGFATYSTCGSFMRGGWIWTAGSGVIQDWYDYLAGQGVVGTAPGAGSTWGPIGDGSPVDYTKGLPRLGNPAAISPDGTAIVGWQGGNQVIPGAPAWVLTPSGSPCVAPAIHTNPAATANFSRCNRFVNLSVAARGSGIAFQWYRANGGSPLALADGVNGNGMTITGAQTAALSLADPTPADADNYYCVVTSACGSVASSSTTVQVDPSIPALAAPAYSTCSAAAASAGVGPGTYAFNPCGQFDAAEALTCLPTGTTSRSAVWFKYVPPSDGEARFQTCAAAYDTNITVWDNCGGIGVQLACNDDVGAGVTGCSSTRSRVARLNVQAGVPVYVRVAGTGTSLAAGGSLQIIQPAPARPANDDCFTAATLSAPIAGVPITVTANYDLAEATTDGSASCVTGGSFRDVWYAFTPPARGTIRAHTCTAAPQYNSVLSFHNGCSFATELACNDNQSGGPAPCGSTQSMIDNYAVTQAAVGQTIYMRVAQASLSTTTTGTFTLRFTASCPADYDGDGNVTPADVAAYVNTWFASLAAATLAGDFDGNGAVQPADVAAFVNQWFATLSGGGCP